MSEVQVGRIMLRTIVNSDEAPVKVLITKIVFLDEEDDEIEGNKKIQSILKVLTCVKLDTMESREYFSILKPNHTWTVYRHEGSRLGFDFKSGHL